MSALDLSLEDIIKQRAKPAQKTAKAKPRRAAARGGGKKTVVRKKTAGKRPRDARGSIFDRLGNADGAKTVEVRNVPYDVLGEDDHAADRSAKVSRGGGREDDQVGVASHWSPYDRVGVVNADP